jgi:aminomethyltransferase
MSKTPFYEIHKSYGAKLVDFAGWEMPLQYEGIIAEHHNVRRNCGLFDVSHMGRIEITGKKALSCVQNLITNDVSLIGNNRALYSPMCYEYGGIVDDLIVYKHNDEKFLLIVNASNRDKDLAWILENANGASIDNISNEIIMLSLQGPKSEITLQKLTNQNLSTIKYFWFAEVELAGISAIVARTGYTGEDGFEILFPREFSKEMWEKIMEAGYEFGIKPIGLGARDTLRLEAGYMLYGNDIDETITPLEATLKWTVHFEKEFIGKRALQERPLSRKMVGFELLERSVPRHGNKVFVDGKEVGYVTSGTFSPTFNKPIGICLIPKDHAPEKEIQINIREKLYNAKVTSTRFYKREVKA